MRSGDSDHDPVVSDLRARIMGADRAILAAFNQRIELVRTLREHKLAQGWDFVDPDREEHLLAALAGENAGPLSEGGLRELFTELLALTKREIAE